MHSVAYIGKLCYYIQNIIYLGGRNMDIQKLSEQQQKEFVKYYVDPNEKYVSSLGNGYITNYLTNGTLNRGFAVISDKRAYFKGRCLSVHGKRLIRSSTERAVDLKDLTGSGFIYKNSIGTLILAIIFSLLAVFTLLIGGVFVIPGLILMITLWIGYFKSRKTLFEIDYAGGKIAFNVSLYPKEEIDDFHKQLRRAKDLILLRENHANIKSNHNSNISIDKELEKYFDLLQKGVISQKEFEDLKRKAIND